MDWFNKLLSVDAPPGARLDWPPELAFRGLFPWWAGALVALVAGVGIIYLYYLERSRARLLRRLLMAALRITAVALLLLLLLRPTLVAEFHGERPRPIVVLIDNSQSMTQRDQRLSARDRLRVAIAENRVEPNTPVDDSVSIGDIPSDTSENPARGDVLRAVVAHPRLLLTERLQRHGPMRAYSFGQRLQSLADAHGLQPVGLSFIDAQTALADAVHEVLVRHEDSPAAIVVMTDGRDNASQHALDVVAGECARQRVPLHIYGVGSSDVGNLQLKTMVIPDTIFAGDVVAVPVLWRCQGFKQGTAEITLTLGGQVVARKEVQVQPGDDFREVLTFVPAKKGEERKETVDLVATITYKGHETFTADNEAKRPVQVIDRTIKVLYVEYAPRWEYKFLMTFLTRRSQERRRVEAKIVLLNADPRGLNVSDPSNPYLAAFPPTKEDLFAFDLLILGDVPASALKKEQMDWIKSFVEEGGGLIHIAGRQHAPAGFHGTPLAEILPVEFTPQKFRLDDEARPRPFVPKLTEFGERSEMLALGETKEDNARIWKELPGVYWHYPVTRLRPGAVALLEHPNPKVRAGDRPMPLMAFHAYGGPVLFMAIDETWRWRYNVRDQYFVRLWGQMVYQVGLPHLLGESKRVQLALERSENVLGRPAYIYARLLDSGYQPLQDERVPAKLEYLDAQRQEDRWQSIMLEKISGLPGEYRVLLPHHAVGRFVLRVERPEPASLEYRVDLPPQHELEIAGMAEDVLRDMARMSGGKFYREEDLHRLPDEVRPQGAPFVQRQHVSLWSAPLTLLLFIALVSLEWLLRKFADLS